MNYKSPTNENSVILLDLYDGEHDIQTMFKYYTLKSLDDIHKYEFNDTITAYRVNKQIFISFSEITHLQLKMFALFISSFHIMQKTSKILIHLIQYTKKDQTLMKLQLKENLLRKKEKVYLIFLPMTIMYM